MSPLLQVEGLQTLFRTHEGVVRAVNGISYTLDQGESLGIVGESGSGKSVSSLSILRLVPQPPGEIAGGKVLFQGRDLLGCSEAEMREIRGKEIAMIFQDPMTSLNPVLTVSRQMTESMETHLGMTPAQARARAVELLEMVGIPSAAARADDYPHQFSGGMRQRVMIAMAISCNPKLLIADEPTTALDVTIQAQILELIKRLRRELGTAVILITHDLGVVAGMCDRVAVMYAGYIVESAPARRLFTDPRHPYTLGLLRSIPRLDADRKRRLVPIEGMPPDLARMPAGCPSVPRCPFARERCRVDNPPLRPLGADHQVACWVDVKTGAQVEG
jgi:oligopeptide transport system ATP-binding protein